MATKRHSYQILEAFVSNTEQEQDAQGLPTNVKDVYLKPKISKIHVSLYIIAPSQPQFIVHPSQTVYTTQWTTLGPR